MNSISPFYPLVCVGEGEGGRVTEWNVNWQKPNPAGGALAFFRDRWKATEDKEERRRRRGGEERRRGDL